MKIDHIVLILLPLAVLLLIVPRALTLFAERVGLDLFGRRLIRALITAQLVLVLLHPLIWTPVEGFWRYFLNLDLELTFGTYLASVQLVLIGLIAAGIGLRGDLRHRSARAYFVLLGLGFLYLGVDEFYILHETLFEPNAWRVPFLIAGIAMAALGSFTYFVTMRQQRRFFLLFLAALVVMAVAAIGMEPIIWYGICPRGGLCLEFTIFEEWAEMVGETIALVALLKLAQEIVLRPRRVHMFRAVLPISGLWLLWMPVYIYVVPTIEARLWATPVNTRFSDGDLSVVGYRLGSTTVQPGDQLPVTIYFRANGVVAEDYHLSVHALAHPEVRSVAQHDDLLAGSYPSDAWIPGVTVSKTVTLRFPDDLPTPASYWISVRLWIGPYQESWRNTSGLLISESDGRLLTPDTLILASVAAPGTAEGAPPNVVDYRFDNGPNLIGYNLTPEVSPGDQLRLQFWWHAGRDVGVDLTQFVHVVNENGEAITAYDSPPFGGRFPTVDWRSGMRSVDEIALPLPPDVPSGEYQVYTGLYTPLTMQREPVLANGSERVAGDSILLGTIRVVEP